MGELRDVFGHELVYIVAALLLAFGYIYNLMVERLQQKTVSYTAELVVVGVLVTLLGAGFVIGWLEVLTVGFLFAASGCWMILGSWRRHADDQARARQEGIDLLKHGD